MKEAIEIVVNGFCVLLALVFTLVAALTKEPEVERKALLWAILILLWTK